MKSIIFKLLIFLFSTFVSAQKVNIAAAANLRYVIEELKKEYLRENPKAIVQITYGSSGLLTQQILNGAPFDLFMSADTKYPTEIKEKGKAFGTMKVYSKGKVVLWSASLDTSQGLGILLSPEVKKIAIANATTAPYGSNAVKALKSQKLYDKIDHKIVWGENINQTAQFAFSGNADVAFIALSLALAPEMKKKGNYYTLTEALSPLIEQGCVLIKGWEKNGEALKFRDYIVSSKSDYIWKRFGYEVADR